jgi:hypothetical protein
VSGVKRMMPEKVQLFSQSFHGSKARDFSQETKPNAGALRPAHHPRERLLFGQTHLICWFIWQVSSGSPVSQAISAIFC